MRRIAAMGGLWHPGAAVSSASLDRLAALSRTPVGALEAMAYRPTGRFAHHRFLTGSLHRELIDLSARRTCPRCLGDHAHHRAAWDLPLLTACTIHRVRLMGRCGRCRRRLSWADPSVILCRCGSDLREWPVVEVGDDEVLANARLLSLASGGDVGWVPTALVGCDPADLVRLAMCLGMFLAGWRGDRRVETLCAAGPDRVGEVMVRGIGALAEWPFPLLGFLAEERGRAAERPGRAGAGKALGPFYAWMRDGEPAEMREAVLAVARASLRTDPVLVRRSHRSHLLFGPPETRVAEGHEKVGLTEAAAMLGRSHATMRRLIAEGTLSADVGEGRGIAAPLDREAVADLARRQADVATLVEAASILGVSKARTRLILGSGLPGVAGYMDAGEKVFSRDGLRTLLRDLEGRVPEGRPRRGRVVGFEHAADALRHRGRDIVGMLALVLDGRLVPVSIDRKAVGLKRLRFDREALRRLSVELDDGPVLTIQAAARRLGLKWEVVAHLVRQGVLHRSTEGIPHAEVERFAREVVSGATLATDLGISPRSLVALIEHRGIPPLSGGADGGRQYFYLRAQVPGPSRT